MIPYNKLTIVRNRHRARDLRVFRELVETYFERAEYVSDDLPVDWEGARAARSQVNQMLPRVLQIVTAAGLDGSPDTTNPGPRMANVDVLRNIFDARFTDGADQEILDVIDMALGVYEASRFNALARTFNPLHYVMATLGFVASIPRRALTAFGFRLRRAAPRSLREDLDRLDVIASRLTDTEKLIERKFAEMRERQAQLLADNTNQLTELAERLDFAERVLAQQRPPDRLPSSKTKDIVTPV